MALATCFERSQKSTNQCRRNVLSLVTQLLLSLTRILSIRSTLIPTVLSALLPNLLLATVRLLAVLVVLRVTGQARLLLEILDLANSVLLRRGRLLADELDLGRTGESKRGGELFEGEVVELENGLVLLKVDRANVGDEGLSERRQLRETHER